MSQFLAVFQFYFNVFLTFFLEEPPENHRQVIGGLLLKYSFYLFIYSFFIISISISISISIIISIIIY